MAAGSARPFAGFEQQDASEFLAMLLEGLSEDLNHVTTKPYIENPDSDDRPDWSVAAEVCSTKNYTSCHDGQG